MLLLIKNCTVRSIKANHRVAPEILAWATPTHLLGRDSDQSEQSVLNA